MIGEWGSAVRARMGSRAVRLWCLGLALLWSTVAGAHLLPKQNATMRLLENSGFLVVSVPVDALSGVDLDGDGKLDAREIETGSQSIADQFLECFQVSDNGVPARQVFAWVVPPQTDGTEPSTDYIVVMHRVDFAGPAEHPQVRTDLFGPNGESGSMTIKASRGEDVEIAILSADKPSHEFFRSGWSIFAENVRIGTGHVLAGYDHLLFLLTVIVMGAGWRYWLSVVTSFTVAHSITLVLSAAGTVSAPASLVEPAIAASIVLMALVNLVGMRARFAIPALAKVGIVFACGLIHGLGFASAIGSLAGGAGMLPVIGGFNVGVELGQLLFLSGVLALAAAGRRMGFGGNARLVPLSASLVALGAGSLLLAAQIGAMA